MAEQIVQVKYSVTMSEREFARIEKQGRAEGYGFNDAGPRKVVARFLADNGLEGAFEGGGKLDIIVQHGYSE